MGHAIGRRVDERPSLCLPSAHRAPLLLAAAGCCWLLLFRRSVPKSRNFTHNRLPLARRVSMPLVPAPNHAATGVARPLHHTDPTPSPLDVATKRPPLRKPKPSLARLERPTGERMPRCGECGQCNSDACILRNSNHKPSKIWNPKNAKRKCSRQKWMHLQSQ